MLFGLCGSVPGRCGTVRDGAGRYTPSVSGGSKFTSTRIYFLEVKFGSKIILLLEVNFWKFTSKNYFQNLLPKITSKIYFQNLLPKSMEVIFWSMFLIRKITLKFTIKSCLLVISLLKKKDNYTTRHGSLSIRFHQTCVCSSGRHQPIRPILL